MNAIRKILLLLLNEFKEWGLFFIGGMPGYAGACVRHVVFKLFLKNCGQKVFFSPGCHIKGFKHITIGNRVTFGINLQLCAAGEGNEAIAIDDYSAFNSNVMINADCGGKIKIGKHVIVGPNVVLRSSNHNFKDRQIPISQQGHGAGEIILEDDVWIGANVTILPNVKIKKGAIIGAGAVVVKDVESYSIVGGIPAKPIGVRP